MAASSIHLQAARIPDRERMLEVLHEAGLEATPVDEVEIEVPCDDEAQACEDLYHYVEDVVMRLGAPFVPVKHEGRIYLRPPVN